MSHFPVAMWHLSDYYLHVFVSCDIDTLAERITERCQFLSLVDTHKRPNTVEEDFSRANLSVRLQLYSGYPLPEQPSVPTLYM